MRLRRSFTACGRRRAGRTPKEGLPNQSHADRTGQPDSLPDPLKVGPFAAFVASTHDLGGHVELGALPLALWMVFFEAR